MPAGDAQRAWFPEMLEDLKSYWSTDWSWKGFSVFCEVMTEKKDQRSPRHQTTAGSL